MKPVSARDYPQVYEMLGIDTGNLGCLMLDTEVIEVSDVIANEDLYIDDDEGYPALTSEVEPHVTLLYGLLRPAEELKKHIEILLSDWNPGTLIIDKVGFFYGKDNQNVAIIAELVKTPELINGNARLRLLPHIDTFDQYRPHITLAYVKFEADWQKYVDALNGLLAGKEVAPQALNYGH